MATKVKKTVSYEEAQKKLLAQRRLVEMAKSYLGFGSVMEHVVSQRNGRTDNPKRMSEKIKMDIKSRAAVSKRAYMGLNNG